MIPCQWTREGFIMRFEERRKTAKTNEEAYGETEKEHINLFGRNRYKNLESFKRSYYEVLKYKRK